MRISDRCPHCGEVLGDHMGTIGTCRRLQDALTALKVIHTWATYRGGVELNPEHITSLIDRTLDKCGVERRK